MNVLKITDVHLEVVKMTNFMLCVLFCFYQNKKKKNAFSGGSPSSAEGVGSIPSWKAAILYASQPKKQNIKQKLCCNKFSEDFKGST